MKTLGIILAVPESGTAAERAPSSPSSSSCTRFARFFATYSFYSAPVASSRGLHRRCTEQFHFGGAPWGHRGQLEAIAHLEGEGETYICLSVSFRLSLPASSSLSLPWPFALFSCSVDTRNNRSAFALFVPLQQLHERSLDSSLIPLQRCVVVNSTR